MITAEWNMEDALKVRGEEARQAGWEGIVRSFGTRGQQYLETVN